MCPITDSATIAPRCTLHATHATATTTRTLIYLFTSERMCGLVHARAFGAVYFNGIFGVVVVVVVVPMHYSKVCFRHLSGEMGM